MTNQSNARASLANHVRQTLPWIQRKQASVRRAGLILLAVGGLAMVAATFLGRDAAKDVAVLGFMASVGGGSLALLMAVKIGGERQHATRLVDAILTADDFVWVYPERNQTDFGQWHALILKRLSDKKDYRIVCRRGELDAAYQMAQSAFEPPLQGFTREAVASYKKLQLRYRQP